MAATVWSYREGTTPRLPQYSDGEDSDLAWLRLYNIFRWDALEYDS